MGAQRGSSQSSKPTLGALRSTEQRVARLTGTTFCSPTPSQQVLRFLRKATESRFSQATLSSLRYSRGGESLHLKPRKHPRLALVAGVALGVLPTDSAQGKREGFYKDLLINCGQHLLCPTPHAAKALDLDYEVMRSRSAAIQSKHFVGYPGDLNGILLYPDGAPRYRAVYVNGGESKDHGASLGAKGLLRFRAFFAGGGSYTGSCAGAFIASGRRMGESMLDRYFGIWPGETKETWFNQEASSWYIGPSNFRIEKDSALLKYKDFGDDLYVEAIKHYEGPFAVEGEHWPEGTQVLARFDLPKSRFHNTPSIWAYQPDPGAGRMVVVASHPENYSSGERLDLMSSIFSYALDLAPYPRLKARLGSGRTLELKEDSDAQKPCLTKVGDGQLHHFALQVPKGSQKLLLRLKGDATLSSGEAAQLELYAQPIKSAWPSLAKYKSKKSGAVQSIEVQDPQPGLWFVSVRGASEVIAQDARDATSYHKNLGALNGIGYRLSMQLDDQALEDSSLNEVDPWCNRPLHEVDAWPKSDNPQETPQESEQESPSQDSPNTKDSQTPTQENSASSKTPSENSSQEPTENAASQQSPQRSGCQIGLQGHAPLLSLLLLGFWRRRAK